MTTSAVADDLPLLDMAAVVTVTPQGFGRAIALHLAAFGARVAVHYTVGGAHAKALATEINAAHPSLPSPQAVAIRSDVSDAAQVTALFDAAEGIFGAQPHILVTSAGVEATHSAIADTPLAESNRISAEAASARGALLCMQEAGKRLKRGGEGRIITVLLSLAAYRASKAAVGALAEELWGTGITVNGVLVSGLVATDIRETKDIASVVGFLAMDSGEWINGQVL